MPPIWLVAGYAVGHRSTGLAVLLQSATIQGNPFLSQPPLTPLRCATPPPTLPPYASVPAYPYTNGATDTIHIEVTQPQVAPVDVVLPISKSSPSKG